MRDLTFRHERTWLYYITVYFYPEQNEETDDDLSWIKFVWRLTHERQIVGYRSPKAGIRRHLLFQSQRTSYSSPPSMLSVLRILYVISV